MSARTGLGPLELALLDAVDLIAGDDGPAGCSDVLSVVESRAGIGARYAWRALLDLGVPWRVHLPLVALYGNAGWHDDAAAEPRYVEAALSDVGRLALASERGELGPIPLGLVEGSWYRDGPVPPFSPDAVVGALLAAEGDAGAPVLPTGGNVQGDVDGLLAGRAVRLRIACSISASGGSLVVAGLPLGIPPGLVVEHVSSRARWTPSGIDSAGPVSRSSPVRDVRDESSGRDGIRIVVDPTPGSDLRDVRDWLLDVWPITVDRDARLPAPQRDRLERWDRGDGSGLRALSDLLSPTPPA